MPIASSMRRLVAATGTANLAHAANKPWRVIFSIAQSFYRGETIAVPSLYDQSGGPPAVYGIFTVAYGDGLNWTLHQLCDPTNYGGVGATSWSRTDKAATRLRGGGGSIPYRVVPGAVHFMYVSPLDASVPPVPDWYTYMDTIFPINGRHPYTRDRWTGQSWVGKDDFPWATGVLVADAANRIAALDAQPPVLSR